MDERDLTLIAINDAMEEHDFERARALLQANPDMLTNDDGTDRWLWSAAIEGDLEVVAFLVEQMKIDVNLPKSLRTQGTAIESAAAKGHVSVVKWLLEHGAAINRDLHGQSTCFSLNHAARDGHCDVVKLLVEHGADILANWRGFNALMEAELNGHDDIATYLRSLGAKDTRETTPPDYVTAHDEFVEHIEGMCGRRSDLSITLPGNPVITIYQIPANSDDQYPNEQTLFTLGLSDHRLPDESDAFHCTEIRLALKPDWPLTEEALADPQWNWPVEWLKRIAMQLRDAEAMPAYPPMFINGDPPQPLAAGTALCGWIGLRASENYLQMPDNRWISLLDLYPIYAEERDFALATADAYEDLAYRFEEEEVPMYVDPQRKRVTLG